MSYQILKGDTTEYEVIEYPSIADEKEFARLLVRTDASIVPQDQKEDLCEKWGWDAEEMCCEDVTGYVDYNLELAKTILKDADGLTGADKENLKPGLIQEARMDFIEGCHGRNGGAPSGSTQGLMNVVRSLLGQNGATTATTEGAPTETP